MQIVVQQFKKPKAIVSVLKNTPNDLIKKLQSLCLSQAFCEKKVIGDRVFCCFFPYDDADFSLSPGNLSFLKKSGLNFYFLYSEKYSYNRSPLEDKIFEQLVLDQSVLPVLQFDERFEQKIGRISRDSDLVFVDFEASYIQNNKIQPESAFVLSEIGAACVHNGKVVALFHAFYDQLQQIESYNVQESAEVRAATAVVENLTQIPSWRNSNYKALKVSSEAEVFDNFAKFCNADSTVLSSLIGAKILQNWVFPEAVPALIAKGVQLETAALNRLSHPRIRVFEFDELTLKILKQIKALNAAELHGPQRKEFDYCEFHAKNCELVDVSNYGQKYVQFPHCGLDDAACLARIYVQRLKEKFGNEVQVEE